VSGLSLRICFAIGVAGVLGSVAVGGVAEVAESGHLPPLMRHPLDPARDALAAGDRRRFVEDHRMFVAIQARDARVLRPLPPIVHAMLASLYSRQGRLAEAREQARLALAEGQPIRPQLRRKLGLEAPGS
jgi:hypothetical protein